MSSPSPTPELPSQEASTQASTQPPRLARGKTDPAWGHCKEVIEPNGNSAKMCIYCKKTFRGGGISRFKCHLAGVVGQVEQCKKVPANVRFQMKQIIEEYKKENEKKKQSPIESGATSCLPTEDSVGLMDDDLSPGAAPTSKKAKTDGRIGIKSPHHFLQMDRVREMEEKLEAVVNAVVNNNHIPRDPAFSVLSKLPLKSLKRFGCASKSWGHLFENSLFMSMYRNNSPHTSLLLNLEFDYSLMYLLSGERFETRVCVDFPSAFPTRASTSYVFGSSVNGILCLYYGHNRVVLWNPSTREFKVVPPSPVEFESPSPVEFESHNQELYFDYKGFGYDHVKDDYRMIRCINFSELSDVPYNLENVSFEPLWEIYSLRSDSWKKLDCKMHTGSLDYCNGARLYTNGACHWWGIDENGLPSCLVSFDLNNELFFTTPMPSYIDGIFDLFHELFITTSPIPSHLFPVQLGVISGSVALISNYSEKTTIEVSILGEVGVKESWTKLFIIGPLPCVVNLVGVGKKGDIFFNNEGELAFFDWSTHMIVGLGLKAWSCRIVTYKENFESLISLGFQKYDCRLC